MVGEIHIETVYGVLKTLLLFMDTKKDREIILEYCPIVEDKGGFVLSSCLRERGPINFGCCR